MGDSPLEALLAQLVEDAARWLGPNCRNEPMVVVERRIEMIFEELVRRRALRNEQLTRLLNDRRLSRPIRDQVMERVFERLRRSPDANQAQ